jgi:hypothetical protein
MMLMDVALSLCRNHFRKSFRTDYNGALVKEGSKIGWEMWKSMTEDVSCFFIS